MKNLSLRTLAIFSYISSYITEYKHSPSFREICRATGITSTAVMFDNLNKLEKFGLIVRKKSCSKSISLVDHELFLYARTIPAKNILEISLDTNAPEIKSIFSKFSLIDS